jgi:phosphoribosylformylglycinamidine synthase II
MTFYNETFDFTSLSHSEMMTVLEQHNIALHVSEVLTIQQDLLKRPPTLTECLLWSIQSSEHCSYKSTQKYLKQFPTQNDDVLLGPCEDAGIVSIIRDSAGYRYGIVISHESHNHPSQVVPFEGAATGVGGNVRDVCCMGAEVIGVADTLRFGDVKHYKTRWIHENVVAGIADYGNALGIPNIGGDLYYDEDYADNCLVTVITLGVLREDQIIHSYAPKNAAGFDLILVGKATDRSGFGGASFASLELAEEDKDQNRGAVQEPNAFLERHLLKAHYALFRILKEKDLLSCVGFKDLGAGGIACASVELAESGGYGAEINLDLVPVSMMNLHPAVILCSETQERFMWVVPPYITPLVLHHYNETFMLPEITENAQAKVIGQIKAGHNYKVYFQGTSIVDADARDITKGIYYDRPCAIKSREFSEPPVLSIQHYENILLDLLAHENIANRKPVFETYDKQVQGRIVIEAGHADASVLQPFNSAEYPEEIRSCGIALGCAQNPRYNKIDPYWGAINAVAEAVRNVVAVGTRPVAITDCLCFGNPENPEHMGDFSEAVRGITDMCKSLGLPVISGNVSLYNESKNGAIPPSPIISCLGKLSDATLAITPHLKQPDSSLVMVGKRKDECGGSVYYALQNYLGTKVPKPDFVEFSQQIEAIHKLITRGLVLSAHDISDGGIAVALAEMSFLNEIGITVNLSGELSDLIKLFSESGGFILEIDKKHIARVHRVFCDLNVEMEIIGYTMLEPHLRMQRCIDIPLSDAKPVWDNGLRSKL